VGIGVFNDEGTVTVVGKDQVTNVSLRIQEDRPRLIFWKKAEFGGTQRINLGQMEDGSHALVFMDERSTPRLSLGVKEDGSPFLVFLTDKTVRASLTVDSEGSPFLNILNKDGKVIWQAP
jgi:hypothetical protein